MTDSVARLASFFFEPNLVVDKDDSVYFSFARRIEGSRTEVVIVKTSDGGRSFGPPVIVTTLPLNTFAPNCRLITDPLGRLTAVWRAPIADGSYDIFLSQSFDGGQTFSSPVNLSANVGGSEIPCGAADSRGNLFIGWVDDSAANDDFFVTSIPSTPDFGVGFNPATLTATRGENVRVSINITRVAGFSGTVTMTPPDSPKIRIKPSSVVTSGNSASFKLKIKPSAAPGSRELTFTGKDDSGRTRIAILRLVIE
jgi:hypothetical protein